jgi:hypothetical protein
MEILLVLRCSRLVRAPNPGDLRAVVLTASTTALDLLDRYDPTDYPRTTARS